MGAVEQFAGRHAQSGREPVRHQLLVDGIEDIMNAKFWVEPDTKKGCAVLFDHIEQKRQGLGI